MKDLLTYILKNITDKEFEIEEKEEDGKVAFEVSADPEDIGLIIGKGGQTIKAIQLVLKVKAKLENKFVVVNVNPKAN